MSVIAADGGVSIQRLILVVEWLVVARSQVFLEGDLERVEGRVPAHGPLLRTTEFLTDLQARQAEDVARADELRARTEDLTGALVETEARLAELATAYQAIVNAFNQHPDQAFRVRELHELLGMPTDDPAMNVIRSRRGPPHQPKLLY